MCVLNIIINAVVYNISIIKCQVCRVYYIMLNVANWFYGFT